MKKLISCFVIVLLACCAVFAQSSEQMSKILESEKASYYTASYLPALYANLISEEASESAAFEALQSNGYFTSEVNPDSYINLAELSYVYMKAFGMKGGLFFTLFDSPRYAFKEFKAQGILPSTSDPDMTVSGHDVIDLFNGCLAVTGGNE